MAGKRRIQITYRIGMALLGLTVVVVQSLDSTKVVKLSKWWELGVLVAVGGITFLDNARQAIIERTQAQQRAAENRVFRAVIGALTEIAESCGVSVTHLGCNIFMVRTRVTWVWSERKWWPWAMRKKLVRKQRIRLSDHPQASKVSWTMGKGAVGKAWQTKRPSHRDWHGINQHWGPPNLGPNPSDFANNIAVGTKAQLEYEEFHALLGKYSEAVAVPIMDDDGNVIGVLSVDVAATGGVSTILDDRAIEKLLETAIGLIRPDLK